MSGNNNFKLVLASAVALPFVKIDREEYLRKALRAFCSDEQIEMAIQYNPAYAEIDVQIIWKIADGAISFETNKVTAISAASGIPGGFAMLGTLPADLTQYMGHLLRIL